MGDWIGERHAREPLPVLLRPVVAVKAMVVAEQQLAQAVASAHQIAADVLARTHQVTQRFLLDAGDPDPVQRTDHQQPQQPLGIAAVGLDPIVGRALDLPGAATTHPTPAASSARASPNPVGPASYSTRAGPGSPAQNSTTSRVTPGTGTPPAHPTRGPSLPPAHFQHARPDRLQAAPEPSTRASHARVPTLTSPPDVEPTVHRV